MFGNSFIREFYQQNFWAHAAFIELPWCETDKFSCIQSKKFWQPLFIIDEIYFRSANMPSIYSSRPCSSLPFRINHQIASGQVVELSICTTVPTKYLSGQGLPEDFWLKEPNPAEHRESGRVNYSDSVERACRSPSVPNYFCHCGGGDQKNPSQHFSNLI